MIFVSALLFLLLRMRLWKPWERAARSGEELRIDSDGIRRKLGSNPLTLAAYSALGALIPNKSLLTEPNYNLLRILCKERMDDGETKPEDMLRASFNFLNIIEQAMEVDFVKRSELDSIILFLAMACYMSFPTTEPNIGLQVLIAPQAGPESAPSSHMYH